MSQPLSEQRRDLTMSKHGETEDCKLNVEDCETCSEQKARAVVAQPQHYRLTGVVCSAAQVARGDRFIVHFRHDGDLPFGVYDMTECDFVAASPSHDKAIQVKDALECCGKHQHGLTW